MTIEEIERMSAVEKHDFYYKLAIEQAKEKYLNMHTEQLRFHLQLQRENLRVSLPSHKTVAACEVIYEELKKRGVVA